MKISTSISAPVSPTSSPDLRVSDQLDRSRSKDGVSLSPDATWVKAIKDEVKREPAIRSELVEQTKQALAAGTYESTVDMDTLVTHFLADL